MSSADVARHGGDAPFIMFVYQVCMHCCVSMLRTKTMLQRRSYDICVSNDIEKQMDCLGHDSASYNIVL